MIEEQTAARVANEDNALRSVTLLDVPSEDS